YPHNSPYAFSENIVINAVELEGLEKKTIIANYKTQSDKSLIVVSMNVFIEQDFHIEINGSKYALTHHIIYIDGVYVTERMFGEKLTKGGMKPSAAYDYTQSVIDGKLTDDSKYAGFNPLKWADLVKRDWNAPDNASTLEDL